ncbi:MAG: hypothetical protein JWQ59_551 [Cryobacterium sp.]|nr:hypothetical protein [Cryobacterium sp.]
MPRTLTPVRGFWLGVVLTVVGLGINTFLITALFAIGGQVVASSDVVWFVVTASAAVVLPLGMTFMALSLVARAPDRPVGIAAEPREDAEGPEDPPSLPPRLNSRNALVTGLVLAALGLVCQLNLANWTQAIQADATFLRDFVVYLGPPLNALMLPLGVLLLPCAWILRILEERQEQAPPGETTEIQEHASTSGNAGAGIRSNRVTPPSNERGQGGGS